MVQYAFIGGHMTRDELLTKYRNKTFTVYYVTETDPFFGRSTKKYFLNENEAYYYYNDCCNSQGGANFEEDLGSMNYEIGSENMSIDEIIREIDFSDVCRFL